MNRLEMNGLGNSGGGIFDEVELNGMTRITGDLECQSFQSAGVVRCSESVSALQVGIEGVASFGELKAKVLNVEGVLKSRESVICEAINGEGYLSIGGQFKAQAANLCGKLKFKGGVEAESVTLQIAARSSFTEFGANQIRITKISDYESWIQRVGKAFLREHTYMEGHLIEGEEIYLEYCHVQNVYGDRIKIGPHCIVEELEYKETLEIDPTSVVKQQKRV